MHVGSNPGEIAGSPDGAKVYVANYYGSTVSVIETVNNTVTATVNVGNNPNGIAFSPDRKKVYVTNLGNLNMSIIDTATTTVIDTIDIIVSIPQRIAINQTRPENNKKSSNFMILRIKLFLELPLKVYLNFKTASKL